MENWESVKGFEGIYEVSDEGRVRSLDRVEYIVRECNGGPHYRRIKGIILKQKIDRYGYCCVQLNHKETRKTATVHRLVAKAFVKGYFNGAHVNHKNLDKTCNKHSNLEWVTNIENQRHANSLGVRSGSRNGMSKLS